MLRPWCHSSAASPQRATRARVSLRFSIKSLLLLLLLLWLRLRLRLRLRLLLLLRCTVPDGIIAQQRGQQVERRRRHACPRACACQGLGLECGLWCRLGGSGGNGLSRDAEAWSGILVG